jgi:hypothetical protein
LTNAFGFNYEVYIPRLVFVIFIKEGSECILLIQVDTTRSVYLFTHGRRDLEQSATDALLANGFVKDKIFSAKPDAVGDVGDYMAMLWMPPTPDHIKIQKITKVESVKPEGMTGLWKGVSKEDLFTIPIKS